MVQPMHTRRPSRQRDRISKVPTNPEDKGPRRRRTRVAEGIYKDQYGLATTVKVNGIQREMRFPAGTSLKAIRKERDELKASLRRQPPAARQTLAHDTARYLDQVGTIVSLVNRQREIEVWLPRFGHLRTLSLPGHVNSLNSQLREWRRSLAASTVNHRRNALTNSSRSSTNAGPQPTWSISSGSRLRRPSPVGSIGTTSQTFSSRSHRQRRPRHDCG